MKGRFFLKQKCLFARMAMVAALILSCFTGCFGIGENDGPSAPETFQLRLEERVLVTVTDPAQVQQLKELLTGAEDIGYVPKTFLLGPELVYTDADGKEETLELDLDSDLFRYDGRFFNYGPGNDNNGMPQLWSLLGLSDWPQEVKDAYPEWFSTVGTQTIPSEVGEDDPTVHMDLWYPDWRWLEIRGQWEQIILDAIAQAAPQRTDQAMPAVEATRFTLHIAYDDGREYDLACLDEGIFLLRDFSTNVIYSMTVDTLQEVLDSAITQCKTE